MPSRTLIPEYCLSVQENPAGVLCHFLPLTSGDVTLQGFPVDRGRHNTPALFCHRGANILVCRVQSHAMFVKY